MAGFMQLQVWQESGVYVEDPDCPGDQVLIPRSHNDNDPILGYREGLWWAWYSAPGYMDRTDPLYAKTARDAARECFDIYGDDEDPEDRKELAAVLWEIRRYERGAR